MAHGNQKHNHLAKSDVHRVRVSGRYVLFTFSDQFGPSLCDRWGEPVNNMPLADEENPFWGKFEAWLAERDRSQDGTTDRQPEPREDPLPNSGEREG